MLLKYRISTAVLFSLLSFGVIAGESYTCEIKAEKTKGWIPSSIQISFNNEKKVTKLYSADYDNYDIDKAKVIRYTKDFREIKYIGTYLLKGGGNARTIHTITILPKLNNKISYMMKFSHASNHHNARGTCEKTELNITKTKTKTSDKPNWKNTQITKQTRLAINLLNGYGVTVDKPKALKLLLLSAKEQDSRALFSLGKMYKDGDGVLKNYKKAFMWFNLAVFNGYHAQAGTNARNEIEDLLDARSLIEAQDLSSQCVKQSYKDC